MSAPSNIPETRVDKLKREGWEEVSKKKTLSYGRTFNELTLKKEWKTFPDNDPSDPSTKPSELKKVSQGFKDVIRGTAGVLMYPFASEDVRHNTYERVMKGASYETLYEEVSDEPQLSDAENDRLTRLTDSVDRKQGQLDELESLLVPGNEHLLENLRKEVNDEDIQKAAAEDRAPVHHLKEDFRKTVEQKKDELEAELAHEKERLVALETKKSGGSKARIKKYGWDKNNPASIKAFLENPTMEKAKPINGHTYYARFDNLSDNDPKEILFLPDNDPKKAIVVSFMEDDTGKPLTDRDRFFLAVDDYCWMHSDIEKAIAEKAKEKAKQYFESGKYPDWTLAELEPVMKREFRKKYKFFAIDPKSLTVRAFTEHYDLNKINIGSHRTGLLLDNLDEKKMKARLQEKRETRGHDGKAGKGADAKQSKMKNEADGVDEPKLERKKKKPRVNLPDDE